MDEPMNLPGRFAIKGLYSDGYWAHHVDAYDEQGAAIDAAEQAYGFDRLFVIDTHRSGAVVWDSADSENKGIRASGK